MIPVGFCVSLSKDEQALLTMENMLFVKHMEVLDFAALVQNHQFFVRNELLYLK